MRRKNAEYRQHSALNMHHIARRNRL